MTLRLTLAALLAFSLACASGGKTTAVSEDETTTPPPPPPKAEELKEPTVNLAKKAIEAANAQDAAGEGEGTGDAAAGDGTAGEDGAAEEPKVEYETADAKTLIKAKPTERSKMRKLADELLLVEAKKMGYTSVTGVKMGQLNCDSDWCTAPVTGTARRVKPAADAGGAAAGDAAAGGATE